MDMRHLLAIALTLFIGPAFANTYEDFSRGIDANNRGDAEAAIQFFTRSIDGGDLAPSYLPSAHLGRARALLHNGHCTFAYADLTDAIKMRPDFVDAYSLRAEANQCLDHDDAALADATAAIHLRPAAGYYFTRAHLLWSAGNFQAARTDLDLAISRDPGNGYFLLWHAVVAQRTGMYDQVRAAQQSAGVSGWPKPLLDLFAGRASPEDIQRAAARSPNQKCEADFYIGEWQLARGNVAAAAGLFRAAEAECPRDYIAFDAARHELRRLP
jgi:lipoprotein NlpI